MSTTTNQPAKPAQPGSGGNGGGNGGWTLPTSKVTAATLAAAIASIAFILIAKFAPSVFTDAELATLQGAVTTILAFGIGYLVKEGPQN